MKRLSAPLCIGLLFVLCSASIPLACHEIKRNNSNATSGVYTIAPSGTSVNATCNMDIDNGGWYGLYFNANIC
jgi:hypothetical protein